jgi:hypothetical protein
MTKIFGIGLNKTGTTTLGRCFELLRYTHTSCSMKLFEDYRAGDFSDIYETVEKFDTFEDWPWPLMYKELDKKYPGSKFILTIRKDHNIWLKSIKKHSLKTNPIYHCRKLAYGYYYPQYNEGKYIRAYEKHNKEVIEYFKNRPNDFLIINWEEGDGWEKLCKFLGKRIPKKAIPHCNKSSTTNKGWRVLAAKILNTLWAMIMGILRK